MISASAALQNGKENTGNYDTSAKGAVKNVLFPEKQFAAEDRYKA